MQSLRSKSELADAIDHLLPQTQCARCGYPSCAPYAHAIAKGESDINRCPPGGESLIERLATLLERESLPLDESCGPSWTYRIAFIDERWCIGCTVCIRACPVDAISGAAKRMHSVIARACTGCELCGAPCPTDCIEMRPAASHPQLNAQDAHWTDQHRQRSRQAFARREQRLARRRADRQTLLRRRALRRLEVDTKRHAVSEAVDRGRQRRRGAGDDQGDVDA